ncbi:unnamed protein product, partial [Musa banksii]
EFFPAAGRNGPPLYNGSRIRLFERNRSHPPPAISGKHGGRLPTVLSCSLFPESTLATAGGVQHQLVIADPTTELDHGLVQAAGTLVVDRGVVKHRLPLPLPLLLSSLRGPLPCRRSRPLSRQLSDGRTAEASRNWRGIGGGNEGGEDGGGGMLQGRHPAVPGGDGAAAKWDPDVHGADPERVPNEVLGGGHPREVRLVQLRPPHKPPPLPPPPLRRLSRQRWRSPRLRREPLLPVRQYLPLPSVRILRRLLLTRSLHRTAPTRKFMRACVSIFIYSCR